GDWKLFAKDDAGYGGGENSLDNIRCCPSVDPSNCDALPNTNDLRFLSGDSDHPWLVTSSDTGVRAYDNPDPKAHASGVHELVPSAFASPDTLKIDLPAEIAPSPDGRNLAIGDRRDRSRPGPVHLRVAIVDARNLRAAHDPLEIAHESPPLLFDGF